MNVTRCCRPRGIGRLASDTLSNASSSRVRRWSDRRERRSAQLRSSPRCVRLPCSTVSDVSACLICSVRTRRRQRRHCGATVLSDLQRRRPAHRIGEGTEGSEAARLSGRERGGRCVITTDTSLWLAMNIVAGRVGCVGGRLLLLLLLSCAVLAELAQNIRRHSRSVEDARDAPPWSDCAHGGEADSNAATRGGSGRADTAERRERERAGGEEQWGGGTANPTPTMGYGCGAALASLSSDDAHFSVAARCCTERSDMVGRATLMHAPVESDYAVNDDTAPLLQS